jgi:hypothetical protein
MLENAMWSSDYAPVLKIFYGKNKFKYRDQTEQVISIPEPIQTIDYSKMSAEDLITMRAILSKNEPTTDKHK